MEPIVVGADTAAGPALIVDHSKNHRPIEQNDRSGNIGNRIELHAMDDHIINRTETTTTLSSTNNNNNSNIKNVQNVAKIDGAGVASVSPPTTSSSASSSSLSSTTSLLSPVKCEGDDNTSSSNVLQMTTSEADESKKRFATPQARAIRLEQNRRAAKDSRRRKKEMVGELQRSAVYLSRSNDALRRQNDELSEMLQRAQTIVEHIVVVQQQQQQQQQVHIGQHMQATPMLQSMPPLPPPPQTGTLSQSYPFVPQTSFPEHGQMFVQGQNTSHAAAAAAMGSHSTPSAVAAPPTPTTPPPPGSQQILAPAKDVSQSGLSAPAQAPAQLTPAATPISAQTPQPPPSAIAPNDTDKASQARNVPLWANFQQATAAAMMQAAMHFQPFPSSIANPPAGGAGGPPAAAAAVSATPNPTSSMVSDQQQNFMEGTYAAMAFHQMAAAAAAAAASGQTFPNPFLMGMQASQAMANFHHHHHSHTTTPQVAKPNAIASETHKTDEKP